MLCLHLAAPAQGDVDVSKPRLCAVTEAVECGHEGKCSYGPVEELNFPSFVWIDRESKTLREHRGERKSVARAVTEEDGQLVLQGYENHAYSITIAPDTGRLSATAAGPGVGFVLFGVCTNP